MRTQCSLVSVRARKADGGNSGTSWERKGYREIGPPIDVGVGLAIGELRERGRKMWRRVEKRNWEHRKKDPMVAVGHWGCKVGVSLELLATGGLLGGTPRTCVLHTQGCSRRWLSPSVTSLMAPTM